jgi:hypothetical protein
LGDTHRDLARAAHRFFIQWHELLSGLLEEAKKLGILRPDIECDALGMLIMSTVEGAILICKASKDQESLIKTIDTLKSVIAGFRV